jgi:hypothetical protein
MSQPAAGQPVSGRVLAAREYAAHLMKASPALGRLSGLNARLVQNYLATKLHRAAKDTDRALAEYGHVRDMTNRTTQQVHAGVLAAYHADRPSAQLEGAKPLVESVVSPQEGWMADWKGDPRPRIEAYAANELGRVGAKAVERAEIWAQNSQSPELTPDEQSEFREAGDLAQLQQVREQAGGHVAYGAATRPVGSAVAAGKGGWVPRPTQQQEY